MSEAIVTGRIFGEEAIARVMTRLLEAGVPRRRIEVVTDLPLPEGVLGGHMKDTRLPWFTALGLSGGLALGLFFSVGTLLLYPLVVGSQAILSPPVFVIVYELTMAGIVVMTFAGLVYENRVRPDPTRRLGITPIGGEAVFVVLVPPDLVVSRVEEALRQAGAEDVWVEPAGGRAPGSQAAPEAGKVSA